MSKYLDGDWINKQIEKINSNNYPEDQLSAVLTIIDDAPTVDAVPVVRCGECKLHGNCTFEETFATAGLAENRRYCGAGERKDEKSEIWNLGKS